MIFHNTILLNLLKTYDDDDMFELLTFFTKELIKRGYDSYDIFCTINDNVKKKGA